MIRTSAIENEEGFYTPVVEVSSDPRNSRCKKPDDSAFCRIVL